MSATVTYGLSGPDEGDDREAPSVDSLIEPAVMGAERARRAKLAALDAALEAADEEFGALTAEDRQRAEAAWRE